MPTERIPSTGRALSSISAANIHRSTPAQSAGSLNPNRAARTTAARGATVHKTPVVGWVVSAISAASLDDASCADRHRTTRDDPQSTTARTAASSSHIGVTRTSNTGPATSSTAASDKDRFQTARNRGAGQRTNTRTAHVTVTVPRIKPVRVLT